MNIIKKASVQLFALNKPKGYLVTRSDDLGRKTVYNLLPKWAFDDGWMPIGRLDLESKGLLLFTRSGKINDMLTKPGNCKKIYEVWVRGFVTQEHIEQAKVGVESKYGLLKAKVEKLGIGGAKTKLKIELEEGKNRHIRRLFGALKDPKFGTPLKVLTLSRISIGNFKPIIESASWRYLSIEEEKSLLEKL